MVEGYIEAEDPLIFVNETVNGYKFNKLFQKNNFYKIYEAIEECTNQKVIVKIYEKAVIKIKKFEYIMQEYIQ